MVTAQKKLVTEADTEQGLPFYRMIDIFIFMFVGAFPLLGFSQFRSEFMAETMAFMILGISIDLIWGFGGMLSLGHAVMFGLGAYIVGIHCNIQFAIPSFMNNQLPALLTPLKSTALTIILALAIPLAFGALLSWFLFKGKVKDVFFTIVTMIVAVMFTNIILDKTNYTNGFNGLQNITFLIPTTNFLVQYYIMFAILLLVYLFVTAITHSKFGIMLKAIKDNEERVQFLGYNTISYKILAFSISSVLAALAGFMFAQVHGAVSVDDVGVTQSVFLVICVAFGGRGYITGALLGTLILEWFKNLSSEYLGGTWPAILGLILLIIVFLMPSGIIGKIQENAYEKKIAKDSESE